jgi:hypothetical protein
MQSTPVENADMARQHAADYCQDVNLRLSMDSPHGFIRAQRIDDGTEF